MKSLLLSVTESQNRFCTYFAITPCLVLKAIMRHHFLHVFAHILLISLCMHWTIMVIVFLQEWQCQWTDTETDQSISDGNAGHLV